MLYNVITSLRCYIMKKELVGANYGGAPNPVFSGKYARGRELWGGP